MPAFCGVYHLTGCGTSNNCSLFCEPAHADGSLCFTTETQRAQRKERAVEAGLKPAPAAGRCAGGERRVRLRWAALREFVKVTTFEWESLLDLSPDPSPNSGRGERGTGVMEQRGSGGFETHPVFPHPASLSRHGGLPLRRATATADGFGRQTRRTAPTTRCIPQLWPNCSACGGPICRLPHNPPAADRLPVHPPLADLIPCPLCLCGEPSGPEGGGG
jgi:hypothetical protein